MEINKENAEYFIELLKAQFPSISDKYFRIVLIIILIIVLYNLAIKPLFEGALSLWNLVKKNLLSNYFLSNEERNLKQEVQSFYKAIENDIVTITRRESWRTENFTDLEAVIQTEGSYYASNIHKYFKCKKNGKRKINGLLEAINKSTETFLVLSGDPGAGKSVALRQLTLDIIKNNFKNNGRTFEVPLYINLKEFKRKDMSFPPTSDEVKDFVINNVRRGDSDTAEFINLHWAKFKKEGKWYFIFDSFDEIPEILHLHSEDPLISSYSEAIRIFLTSQALPCKGIIASREFRGPSTLGWTKFKILRLGRSKQFELINNSNLNYENKKIIKNYIYTSNSGLMGSPLFLSLLCRFVKKNNREPKNDHQLVNNYLDDLFKKDTNYVKDNYKLSERELKANAKAIAELMVLNPTMSLSPTFQELSSLIVKTTLLKQNLQNVLNALTYIKIGKSEGDSSDENKVSFSFAHRRYQETLFSTLIATSEIELKNIQILTDSRWREYAITIFESQSEGVLEKYINEALVEINKSFSEIKMIKINKEQEVIDWKSIMPGLYVIDILECGLKNRHDIDKSKISTTLDQLLTPIFEHGNIYDQYTCMKYSGLCSEKKLTYFMSALIQHQNEICSDLIFSKSIFLRAPEKHLETFISKKLSDLYLLASSTRRELEIELIAASLPAGINESLILHRAKTLKSFSIISKMNRTLLPLSDSLPNSIASAINDPTRVITDIMALGVVILTSTYTISGGGLKNSMLFPLVTLAVTASLLFFISLYIFRFETQKLSFNFIFERLIKQTSITRLLTLLKVSLAVLIVLLTLTLSSILFDFILTGNFHFLKQGFTLGFLGGGALLFYTIMIVVFLINWIGDKHRKTCFKKESMSSNFFLTLKDYEKGLYLKKLTTESLTDEDFNNIHTHLYNFTSTETKVNYSITTKEKMNIDTCITLLDKFMFESR